MKIKIINDVGNGYESGDIINDVDLIADYCDCTNDKDLVKWVLQIPIEDAICFIADAWGIEFTCV